MVDHAVFFLIVYLFQSRNSSRKSRPQLFRHKDDDRRRAKPHSQLFNPANLFS